jgi:hypothetical protein
MSIIDSAGLVDMTVVSRRPVALSGDGERRWALAQAGRGVGVHPLDVPSLWVRMTEVAVLSSRLLCGPRVVSAIRSR